MMDLIHSIYAFLTATHGSPDTVLALPPLILAALVGAGLGAAKGLGPDADKERSDKNLAASITRWSPWTGMKAPEIKYADPLGSAMQGGMAGLQFGSANPGLLGGADKAVGGVTAMKDASSSIPSKFAANAWNDSKLLNSEPASVWDKMSLSGTDTSGSQFSRRAPSLWGNDDQRGIAGLFGAGRRS